MTPRLRDHFPISYCLAPSQVILFCGFLAIHDFFLAIFDYFSIVNLAVFWNSELATLYIEVEIVGKHLERVESDILELLFWVFNFILPIFKAFAFYLI